MRERNKGRIGVKYCGGCNPMYDRVAAMARIKKALQGKAVFVSYEEKEIDRVLVVCGCETACVDVIPFEKIPVHRIVRDAEVDGVIDEIKRSFSSVFNKASCGLIGKL